MKENDNFFIYKIAEIEELLTLYDNNEILVESKKGLEFLKEVQNYQPEKEFKNGLDNRIGKLKKNNVDNRFSTPNEYQVKIEEEISKKNIESLRDFVKEEKQNLFLGKLGNVAKERFDGETHTAITGFVVVSILFILSIVTWCRIGTVDFWKHENWDGFAAFITGVITLPVGSIVFIYKHFKVDAKNLNNIFNDSGIRTNCIEESSYISRDFSSFNFENRKLLISNVSIGRYDYWEAFKAVERWFRQNKETYKLNGYKASLLTVTDFNSIRDNNQQMHLLNNIITWIGGSTNTAEAYLLNNGRTALVSKDSMYPIYPVVEIT